MTPPCGNMAPIINRDFLQRVGIVFAVVAVMQFIISLPSIAAMNFPDPDDTLRLQQVRDLLAGQSWFDLRLHRVDAPNGGVPMHWSRLVDIPLALSMMVLAPMLGQSAAEMVTLVIVPLATLAIALLLVGRIAWRTFGAQATVFACLAMSLSIPVVQQLRPLRIDHHGWQIVLALVAANGLLAQNPRRGGWTIGLALAVWLSISIEGLPMAAIFMAVLALRWLRDEGQREWLVNAMLALAAGSVTLFLASRGLSDLVNHCDGVSPVYLAMFAWGAAGIAVLARFRPCKAITLAGGFGLIAAGALGILFVAAPQCSAGGFSGLDPLVEQYWFSSVTEGLPVWRQPIKDVLAMLIPPLIGLVAAIRLYRVSQGWQRRFWFDYALVLGGSILVAMFVARAASVAGALAAVPLGWQIAAWYGSLRQLGSPAKRAAALAALVLALMPTLPFTIFTMASPVMAKSAQPPPRVSNCRIASAAPGLRRLGDAEVLAPLDINTRIMFESDVKVFATGHHRGNDAMREVITMFISSSEAARDALRARGTGYVALCPDLSEPMQYAYRAPDGFAADLLNGRTPDWLEPVETGGNGSFLLWRVRP